jgi:hypothetical protein
MRRWHIEREQRRNLHQAIVDSSNIGGLDQHRRAIRLVANCRLLVASCEESVIQIEMPSPKIRIIPGGSRKPRDARGIAGFQILQ